MIRGSILRSSNGSDATASSSSTGCCPKPSSTSTRPLVTDAVATRKRDAPPLEERSAYAQSFHQCINLWEDYPAIRPLTFHPRSGRPRPSCSASTACGLWHDQALYKEAGGRATDAHQDHPYWPIVETASVTAWIPFRGSTLASGAMGYLPGSHTVGVRTFVNIFTAEDPAVLMDQPEIRAIEPVYVEVPKGSVAFHHGSPCTWRSRTPPTDDRAVHTIIYIADGAHPPQQQLALLRRPRRHRGRRADRRRGARRSCGPGPPGTSPLPRRRFPRPSATSRARARCPNRRASERDAQCPSGSVRRGLRRDLVDERARRGQGARSRSRTSASQKTIWRPALDDPAFRDRVLLDDRREVAQLHVDREQGSGARRIRNPPRARRRCRSSTRSRRRGSRRPAGGTRAGTRAACGRSPADLLHLESEELGEPHRVPLAEPRPSLEPFGWQGREVLRARHDPYATRVVTWTNWSGNVEATPARIASPVTEADVQAVVVDAARDGLAVRPAGSRHSFTPLCATDGVAVDLHALAGIEAHRRRRAHRDRAGRHPPLGDRRRAPRGRARAAQPGRRRHADGERRDRHRNARDRPRSRQPVDRDHRGADRHRRRRGRVRERGRAPGLYQAARLSLGALGIITAITFRCVPAYNLHERVWFEGPDSSLDLLHERVEATRHYEFFWYPFRDLFEHKSLALTNAPADPAPRPQARTHRPLAQDLPERARPSVQRDGVRVAGRVRARVLRRHPRADPRPPSRSCSGRSSTGRSRATTSGCRPTTAARR